MDPGFYVIDIDGTLVTSDSDFKQGAAATYKKGFGFYPMMAYLDATGEPLAGLLRPGNAGSGTATDYIEVLDASLTQLPISPTEHEIIARSDSAGCLAPLPRRLPGTPGALLCRSRLDRDHGPGGHQRRRAPVDPGGHRGRDRPA